MRVRKQKQLGQSDKYKEEGENERRVKKNKRRVKKKERRVKKRVKKGRRREESKNTISIPTPCSMTVFINSHLNVFCCMVENTAG